MEDRDRHGLMCRDSREDGAFAAALRLAVQVTTDRTGQRQQYVDPAELVKAVNECFEPTDEGGAPNSPGDR
ncbi:hypothetical protein ACH4S8_09485 [Streptomyces sp. NPDC021080]|uniref:hypothetical protein n=1 Tax=Streptomyces sp. NPDC021080 TaxID=3365110 RepID=UPI0037B73F0A